MAQKSWPEWVSENIERKCEPKGIASVLLKNKFTLPQVRELMGRHFPEGISEAEATVPTLATTAAPKANAQAVNPEYIARKRESLMKLHRDLMALDVRRTTIERKANVSRQEFLESYYAANRPVILTGLMEDWKARTKWTPSYLKKACGEAMVEIMAARESNPLYEMDDAAHRKQVRFAEFVDMANAGGESNDFYLTARNNFFALPGAAPLLKDFTPFPAYLKDAGNGSGTFFWYGPKGTVTPLHHDPMNIFMAQVKGRKRVLMVPAEQLDYVYNHYAVYSLVDPAKPDYEKFPEFRKASVVELELAAGEVLFLPAGWWHWVKSLDISMTIAFNNFVYPNTFEWNHHKPTY